MRILFLLLAVVLTYPYQAEGQTCGCESKFEWTKSTFEENDAGFQYIIDIKGQEAYDLHNRLTLEKIRAVRTSTECTTLLYEWLTFFRTGHIGIERLVFEETPASQNVSQTADVSTREIWSGDISQFEKYISEKKTADFEGIWENGAYKIGIRKEGAGYIGFIIEADVDGWREPGQVKLKIEQDGDKCQTTYFMRNHLPVISGTPEFMGENYLQIGNQRLKRLQPYFPDNKTVEDYIISMYAGNPYLEELNPTTLYLRIPSFGYDEKEAIDKVIADNKDKILATENLIIDLRYNGGGADQSYEKLLPILYTNPIRTVSVEFLSTSLNNRQILDLSVHPDLDEGTRQWAKKMYDKLQSNPGEFVLLHDEPYFTHRNDTTYEYPKNVGIIINEGCGSTTEEFALAAKQSKKVKLFGVPSSGALDVSNMSSAESPCGEFRLWYCMSRSLRIPEMAIDDIGIQPDFYLDKSIPQFKWVEYVNDILNQ